MGIGGFEFGSGVTRFPGLVFILDFLFLLFLLLFVFVLYSRCFLLYLGRKTLILKRKKYLCIKELAKKYPVVGTNLGASTPTLITHFIVIV